MQNNYAIVVDGTAIISGTCEECYTSFSDKPKTESAYAHPVAACVKTGSKIRQRVAYGSADYAGDYGHKITLPHAIGCICETARPPWACRKPHTYGAKRWQIETMTREELARKQWGRFAFWHDGQPDFARPDYSAEFRTVYACELYGAVDTPRGWQRVQDFAFSGEFACPRCGDGTGNEDARGTCKKCEHSGLIYLGEGWRGIVFSRPYAED